ncbi:MAG: hypothetical protein ACAI37_24050 [Chthoniobacter sp.]
MNVDHVIVTDEKTTLYNCLGWTLRLKQWVWPWPKDKPVNKVQFDALYKKYGYRPIARGGVAVLGNNTADMLHGVLGIRGLVSTPLWESKCGDGIRIRHDLDEMQPGFYGTRQGFYSNQQALTEMPDEDMGHEPSELAAFDQTETLHLKAAPAEQEQVTTRAAAVDAALRARFDRAYAAWKATWSAPEVSFSSNPGDRAKSPEFREVVALGPDCLPLIMEKLACQGDFFALQAADELLRAEHRVTFELEDERVLGGEQLRAQETVRRWLNAGG